MCLYASGSQYEAAEAAPRWQGHAAASCHPGGDLAGDCAVLLVRGMKGQPIDGDQYRVRFSLTVRPEESEPDAIGRAVGEMLTALPATHQAQRVRVSFERDRRGRADSRRVFLTLIGEERPTPAN